MKMNDRPRQQVARANVGDQPKCDTALLIIDMISDFDFEDGEKLWEASLPLGKPISALKERVRSAGLPVIYVNDNFGNWQQDFEKQVNRIVEGEKRGADLIRQIMPAKDDYYILKPQRSGFYETPLSVLLASMKIERVILAGVTTDICVFFTAHDAYMRGFEVAVPSDCTAAVEERYRSSALDFLERVVNADIRPSGELDI
jgi:nicotinamidase-related amidase